jgi:hypothetical protein
VATEAEEVVAMEVTKFILDPVICADEDIGGGYGGGDRGGGLFSLSRLSDPC